MNTKPLKHFLLRGVTSMLLAIALAFLNQPLNAASLEIQFTGLDIAYDGLFGEITDSTDPLGGIFDPAEADPLNTVTLLVDGLIAGPTLTSDIFADVGIADVVDIPVAGGSVTTSPDAGIFDLLLPAVGLALSLDEVTINYLPLGFVDVIFGGSLATVDAQDLPYGLDLADPVTLSFSTQIVPGTLTDDGTYLTGFLASGTGEIRGETIPEPTGLFLALTGLMIGYTASRRHRLRDSTIG